MKRGRWELRLERRNDRNEGWKEKRKASEKEKKKEKKTKTKTKKERKKNIYLTSLRAHITGIHPIHSSPTPTP